MRIQDLLEATSYPVAVKIFLELTGVDPRGLDKKALQNAYRAAAKNLHPDRGADVKTMQAFNDAYDVLKANVGQSSTSSPGQTTRREEPTRTPTWAMAGHSGGMPPSASIYRQDYRDMNYIKKTMWELSDHSRHEYTLWGFDGRYFRNTLTVYGGPSIFNEMAEAMVTWQTKGGNPYACRAVLVNARHHREMRIIYADGHYYGDEPVAVEHDSFNSNPANDPNFVRDLIYLLDDLKVEHGTETPA